VSTTTSSTWAPARRSGWPVRRMPKWTLLVALVLIAGGVLVALSHKPSRSEQVADFNSYLSAMNTGVESCAGGLAESQQALDAVEAGSSANLKTAISLTTFNASNCSLASNEALDDLTQYQVTESLAKFNLETCTDDYVAWSSDADQAQLGMLAVLKADGSAARASATVALQHDLATLNADRATIAAILHPAEHTLADPAPLPALPS
jgi:hypothetical protein